MIKIGNCPDSWGVWFSDNEKQPDWHTYLDEVAEAGYKYTEIGPYGYMSTDPKELKAELDKRNLVPVAGTIMFDLYQDDQLAEAEGNARKACQLLHDIGAEYYIVMDGMYTNLLTDEPCKKPVLSETEFANLCSNYRKLAKVIEEYKIKPVFHPHGGTNVETEKQIDAMLEQVPEMRICFDTGHHIYVQGNDVYAYTEKIGAHIDFLHYKDLVPAIREQCWKEHIPYASATKHNVFAEIGRNGTIDWKRYGEVLKKIGYSGYAIIEHDCYPPVPGESLRIQRNTGIYLESVGCGSLK